jgi:Asp/Glu/hydantoin racemase
VKIMVINPNASETVTGPIMDSGRRAAAPGTDLVAVTTKGSTVRCCSSSFAINVHVEECVTDRARALRELTEQIQHRG